MIEIPFERLMKVTLKRLGQSNYSTIGVLMYDDEIIACTLEPAWKNNEKDVSCIPKGEYVTEVVESPKFGIVYEIKQVPNRSHILIHVGNYESDTSGCVLVGDSFSFNGSPALLNSRKKLNEIMNFLPEKFLLEIV